MKEAMTSSAWMPRSARRRTIAAFIEEETPRWTAIVQSTGVKLAVESSADTSCGPMHSRAGMRTRSKEVVIIGGGIGGLAAALALLQRGLDVEIHEQAPELKEVGAGIQISSNGTRVLYALGLEDALKRVQVLPSGRVIRHWATGETWNWFDLGAATRERYGTPHVMLHRGDLHGVLADAVRARKPDAVKLDRRCAGIEIARRPRRGALRGWRAPCRRLM